MPSAPPNKFPGNCANCGLRVEALAGLLAGKVAGKWTVKHSGSCPSEGPGPVQPAGSDVGFVPTAEQLAIVAQFATGRDLVVQAGAGTGKTSTLRLLAQHALANGRRGQYTAFNKAIVVDTAGKMPGNVNCSTMHSLAWQHYVADFGHRLRSARQRPNEQANILGLSGFLTVSSEGASIKLPDAWLAGKAIQTVRRFCQSADPEVTERHVPKAEALDDAANKSVARFVLPYAVKAWADLSSPSGRLRFSHDVYLKLWQLGSPRINADFVMLDEAQDADPVQVSIIEQQRQHGTQIVVVGDEQQVIYEWRGAVDALARFEKMGAEVGFLSQSFRFGDAIAAQANVLLGRLGARLRITGYGPVASHVGPVLDADAILCRTNAGAIRAMLGEIDAGRRPHLVGSGAEVILFCEAAKDLMAGRSTSHPELAVFENWSAVETYVAEDEGGADLKLMVRIIKDFGVDVILSAIRNQPAEKDADVVLSTAHKAKGREWDRVAINSDFAPPKSSKDGEDSEMSAPELRLAYVACTRAKYALDLAAVPHFSE